MWPSIEPYCAQAIGRKDWTPEAGERPEAIYTDREYKTQVGGVIDGLFFWEVRLGMDGWV